MRKFHVTILAVCLSVMSLSASANDFDGSKPLICASLETFECGANGECVKGTAASVNAPQFIWLDFVEKMARGSRPDGQRVTSEIEKVTQSEGELILQGVQSGRGWSMAIAQQGGKMVLTAAGEQVAFVVFGACTPL